jgi:SRSO17 transposase
VIGALDETGQEKTGSATAGVQRQYLGCAGKLANGINTVHLAMCTSTSGTRSSAPGNGYPGPRLRIR